MITPLNDYVLIREIKNAATTDSGLVVPQGADIPYSIRGEIVNLGSKVSLPIEIGDVVLFKRYGFELIEVDKEEYLIGKEENVYAVC